MFAALIIQEGELGLNWVQLPNLEHAWLAIKGLIFFLLLSHKLLH